MHFLKWNCLNLNSVPLKCVHKADDMFKCIFLNEIVWIWIVFHWNVFIGVWWVISRRRFRQWLDTIRQPDITFSNVNQQHRVFHQEVTMNKHNWNIYQNFIIHKSSSPLKDQNIPHWHCHTKHCLMKFSKGYTRQNTEVKHHCNVWVFSNTLCALRKSKVSIPIQP